MLRFVRLQTADACGDYPQVPQAPQDGESARRLRRLPTEDYVYDGSEHRQAVTMRNHLLQELVEWEVYAVSYEGDLVMATLRFGCREYNGQMFQDIVATEMIKR